MAQEGIRAFDEKISRIEKAVGENKALPILEVFFTGIEGRDWRREMG